MPASTPTSSIASEPSCGISLISLISERSTSAASVRRESSLSAWVQAHEFIRRFLIHVLPKGQHRIRHYGLFANGGRAANIARIRELLAALAPTPNTEGTNTVEGPRVLALPCPCCGGRLIIVEAFGPGGPPQHRPSPEAIDSS